MVSYSFECPPSTYCNCTNKSWIRPRIVQAIALGLVFGSLFYQLQLCQVYNRMGLMVFAVVMGGFSNMPEIPLAVESRRVVSKQLSANFYSPLSYVFSVFVLHVPIAAYEIFLLSIILYFMTGFTYEPGRYFFFYLCMYASVISTSVMYRSIAYMTPNPDVANQLAGPITTIFLLFAGFAITYGKIPNFMQWLYWVSPFSWLLRSLAQNEFGADRYVVATNSSSCSTQPGDNSVISLQPIFLQAFQIPSDPAYKWSSIGFLFGFFTFFMVISVLALKYKVLPNGMGTTRTDDEDDVHHQVHLQAQAQAAAGRNQINNVLPTTSTSSKSTTPDGAAHVLPFEPVTIAFSHLHYTIKVQKNGKQDADRVLINNVSGYVKPGTLTALMGSSGAGKTTLLDVIAGRKTAGKIEGQILVNGYPKHEETFSRVAGYVEQADVHTPTATVREALMFSARLRLGASVTHDQRVAFVDQVLDILELGKLADRMIGDEVIPGLSPGQMKRVTIGAELVANPSVLFLDEPTSHLDARSALVVMRVIKRIASTGRSVICTIHQPSAELFYMFDRLLLLKTGGKEVFFGDIGERACALVNYFETIEGGTSPKKPIRSNPAAWMLDVIGAGHGAITASRSRIVDHAELYAASPLYASNIIEIQHACQPDSALRQLHFRSRFARSFLYQWIVVQHRFFQFYWRNVPFNLTRLGLLSFLGILFGLVYFDLGVDDYAGVNSKIAVILMTVAFNGVLHALTALPVLVRQRAVYYRERASDTYGPFAYSTSVAIVEIPYVLCASCLFVVPFYLMAGFPSDARLFLEYLLFHFLLSLTYSYAGQFIAVLFPNMMLANLGQGFMFIVFLLFGGVYIRPPDIPKGWIWMYYLNPVPKALLGICASQFECSPGNLNACGYIGNPTTNSIIRIDQYVQQVLDFGLDAKWFMVGWLVLTLLVFHALAAFTIAKVSHVTR